MEEVVNWLLKLINSKKIYGDTYLYVNSTTKFGQTNQKIGTNIDHNDKKLRTNYIKRHLKDLKTNDYKRAGYLSLFLLWNRPNLKESVKVFNKGLKIITSK